MRRCRTSKAGAPATAGPATGHIAIRLSPSGRWTRAPVFSPARLAAPSLCTGGAVVFVPASRVHACNPLPDTAWSYQMLHLDAAWRPAIRFMVRTRKPLQTNDLGFRTAPPGLRSRATHPCLPPFPCSQPSQAGPFQNTPWHEQRRPGGDLNIKLSHAMPDTSSGIGLRLCVGAKQVKTWNSSRPAPTPLYTAKSWSLKSHRASLTRLTPSPSSALR